MVNFKRISGVLESKMSLILRMLLIVAFLAFAGCATATKQPSLYDTQPDLLTKQYTPDEIKAIEQNFNDNPLQYSQQLGNLLLWQMHQKSPQFALEFAQTPELNDGINAKEARAMISIYNLIKGLDIPRDLFEEKAQYEEDIHKIIMEWRGNKREKGYWGGWFPHSNVLSVEPLGFEKGEDYIIFVKEQDAGDLSWKSLSNKRDPDGFVVTLKAPKYYDKLMLNINTKPIFFKISELLAKNQLSFNEKDGLEGTLVIKNASETNLPPEVYAISETNLTPEVYAIRDMVLAGEGDFKFSAPLQALVWGYLDGKFKECDNPFENYQGVVEFVKPIWGKMEGDRWEKFKDVTSRLNLPELIDYYEKVKFVYKHSITQGYDAPAKWIFKKKRGSCGYYANFTKYCLKKAGYDAFGLCFKWGGPGEGHHIAVYKEKGKYYSIDNARMSVSMRGPFNTIEEVINAVESRTIFDYWTW